MLIEQHCSLPPASLLQAMPKIDLHRHLEGSLRLSTLLEIANAHALDLPHQRADDLRPLVQMLDDEATSQTFLAKFRVLRRFYRSPALIRRLTIEAIQDAAADNVQYLELRFSPQALARDRGFGLRDVTEWVIEATTAAQVTHPIEVGLIVTLLRHEPELARDVADIAFDLHNKGIVGLDLAGDEVNFSSEPFKEIFQEAHRRGMGITVHAGEWQGPEEVRYAIESLHANRLGHGVRVVENPDVLALAKERNIAFEVCLTSNVQTGVVDTLRRHPLAALHNAGVLVTLNSDDPSVSAITLSNEYGVASGQLGLHYQALRRMILDAAQVAFLPAAARIRLMQQFARRLPHQPPLPTLYTPGVDLCAP